MAFIDIDKGEIHCKVVYFGPPYSGKFTNIEKVYNLTHLETNLYNPCDKIICNTSEEYMGFICCFNFIPNKEKLINNLSVRFHLFCLHTLIIGLEGVKEVLNKPDGIVFVADGQPEKLNDNLEWLKILRGACESLGIDLANIPYVLQLNKIDIANAISVTTLEKKLKMNNESIIHAEAKNGYGVFETLEIIISQIYKQLEQFNWNK
jgi:mutual gliding-motility protein MglA